MRIPRLTLAGLAMCGVLVAGGLMFTAAPALAGTGYGFSFSFASPEGFSGPVGLAVDDSAGSSNGDVYVLDQGNNALKKFSVSGETATQEWKVELPNAQPNQATVDDFAGPDEGDVYVAGYATSAIYQVNAAGTSVTEVLTGLSEPTGVAVDAAGDFFVSLNSGSVLEYNSAWQPVNAAGVEESANTVVEGLNGGVQNLAVSANGEEIYVATGAGAIQATLMAGSFISTTLDPNSAKGVTVAPSGDVFVDQGNEIAEYEPSGTLLVKFGAHVLSGEAYGVGVSSTGVYVADHEANQIDAFVEGPTPEVAVTGTATEITSTSALLHGKLNPEGVESSYYFAYNTNGSCEGGGSTPTEEAGSGNTEVEESTLATGLEPSKTYTFCFVAENTYGSTLGAPETFTTLPAAPGISGLTASNVTSTAATLEAQINPNNQETTYTFEYSTKATGEILEGTITTLAGAGPLTGFGNQTASVATNPLTPGTTYYYRVVAENTASETSTSEPVASFITQNTPVVSTGSASSITRTSAVLGGQVNPGGLETHYYIQYSSNNEYVQNGGIYNQQAPGLPGQNAGAGNNPVVLGSAAEPQLDIPAYPTITLTELTPGAVYDYRLVATNADGTTYGAPGSFTTAPPTPPIPTTGAANGVSQSSATITGSVNTQGLQTTTWFELGSTTGLGSLEQAQLASKTGTNISVEASFGSLQPGSTYYYRVRATNQDGTEYGAIQSFTTIPAPPAATFPTIPLLSAPPNPAPATPKTTTTTATKQLTRAQKLAKALHACRAKHNKHARGMCEAKAHKTYAPPKPKHKHKKR